MPSDASSTTKRTTLDPIDAIAQARHVSLWKCYGTNTPAHDAFAISIFCIISLNNCPQIGAGIQENMLVKMLAPMMKNKYICNVCIYNPWLLPQIVKTKSGGLGSWKINKCKTISKKTRMEATIPQIQVKQPNPTIFCNILRLKVVFCSFVLPVQTIQTRSSPPPRNSHDGDKRTNKASLAASL